jgi:selenocysteine-specific elongation factor
MRHLLLGTAGHIDHGKTSLVRQLTGIDTDRLPEEKARGISIDLGFAHWERDGFQFGIVDVPGHERFLRNMVAGATGIDLALLVIAADDGVMPQTREHLEVMQLLGIRTGVIALTKCDLIGADLLSLVREEAVELVAGTFLAGAPVVAVSSRTGEGFDALTDALIEAARRVPSRTASPLFLMAIDRAFSLPGRGTVVTGSVISGEVRVGDTVDLLPASRTVRVRGVQSHGAALDCCGPSQRTGINLAGVHVDEVERGMELATAGSLIPSTRLLVDLSVLNSSPVPLKTRSRWMLHVGTAEVECRVVRRGAPLEAGESGEVELRTRRPVVATWGQRFILRRVSPPRTVAGGIVLDPAVPPAMRLRDPTSRAAAFRSTDPEVRLMALLAERDEIVAGSEPNVRPSAEKTQPKFDALALEAAARAGVPPHLVLSLLQSLESKGALDRIGPGLDPILMARTRCKRLANAMMRLIRAEMDRHKPQRAVPPSVLLGACRELASPRVVLVLFEELVRTGRLRNIAGRVGPAELEPRLTRRQQALRATLLSTIGSAGLMPPTVKEFSGSLKESEKEIRTLLELAVEDGELMRVDETLYLTPAALEAARVICERIFAARQNSSVNEPATVTVSELREAWGVTRKFAFPLCGWFDERQTTVRAGDVRRAGPRLREPLVE